MSGSSEERLLSELCDIAGKYQAVTDRLHRHAELCTYPSMKTALVRLAAKEDEHVKALSAILSQYRRWARPIELPAREGTSNWERLTGDFAILSEISTELGRLVTHWKTLDPEIGERLQAIVDQDADVLAELRKLALKADPQALD